MWSSQPIRTRVPLMTLSIFSSWLYLRVNLTGYVTLGYFGVEQGVRLTRELQLTSG